MSTHSNSKDVGLSKTLSWLLRHGAVKEGLNISSNGYVSIEELLRHKSLKDKFTLDDIQRVVETNEKKRFTLQCNNDVWEICANQGHSLKVVGDLQLQPLLNSEGVTVIHGTFYRNWDSIKTGGLSRMKRNHIHFALGLPGDKNIISGIRQQAEVFIYINLDLAIADGIHFFKSVNNVVLSPGDERGIIEPKYFFKVLDIHGRKLF